MLKKVKLYFYKATSSLDADTEYKIQEAIKILTKNRTTVVIAHRLSTIMMSDSIDVLENGKIVANGKHEELVKNSKYIKIFTKTAQKKLMKIIYKVLILIVYIFLPFISILRIYKKRKYKKYQTEN